MTFLDLLVALSLVIFVIAWWRRSYPVRDKVLTWAATFVLFLGVIGVVNYRWQLVPPVVLAFALLVIMLAHSKIGIRRRTGKPWVSGPLITVFSVLALLPVYLFPMSNLPAPAGMYKVGVVDFELADTNRLGVFAAKPGEPRRLLVRVWYPSDDVAGIKARPYFAGKEVESTAQGFGQPLGAPFLLQHLKYVSTNSYPEAPLLTGAEQLPVVLFNHGHGVFLGQSTALMEHLASNGYLVFSIHHTYDAYAAVMPDGGVIDMDPALFQAPDLTLEQQEQLNEVAIRAYAGDSLEELYQGRIEQQRIISDIGVRLLNESPEIWLDDIQFVLERLTGKEVPESVEAIVLAGDFENVSHVGMSFGGSAAAAFCMKSKSCVAAVNLDGTSYHNISRGNNIPVPFLMMNSDYSGLPAKLGKETAGRGDNEFNYEWLEAAGLRDNLHRFMVKDSMHMSYSDYPLFLRAPLRPYVFGSIDPLLMMEIQNEFVAGFLDRYQKGAMTNFPNDQLQKFGEWVIEPDLRDIREWWVSEHPDEVVEKLTLETDAGEIDLIVYPAKSSGAVNSLLQFADQRRWLGSRVLGFSVEVEEQAKDTGDLPVRGVLFCEIGKDHARETSEPLYAISLIPDFSSGELQLPLVDDMSQPVAVGRILEGSELIAELPLIEGSGVHCPEAMKEDLPDAGLVVGFRRDAGHI